MPPCSATRTTEPYGQEGTPAFRLGDVLVTLVNLNEIGMLLAGVVCPSRGAVLWHTQTSTNVLPRMRLSIGLQ
jgi:hypothetical protein